MAKDENIRRCSQNAAGQKNAGGHAHAGIRNATASDVKSPAVERQRADVARAHAAVKETLI
jgi:hypothetical protein